MPCFEDDLHATPQTEELEQERKGGKESGNKRLGKGGKKKKRRGNNPSSIQSLHHELAIAARSWQISIGK